MEDQIYPQIAGDLREKIESGELAPGAQLPAEVQPCEHYGRASRSAVRDAVRWLASRRLVRTRRSRGSFVAANAAPFIGLNPAQVNGAAWHGTAFTDDLSPIRCTVTAYPSERTHFVLNHGSVPPLKNLMIDLTRDSFRRSRNDV
jgi:DNA-binding FadR family transcriptional regulator